jgi:predicted O-methyltransferase YrrM
MRMLIHCAKFLLGLEEPGTQVTDREMTLLLKYSSQAKVLVELGCFEGKTSAALAANVSGIVYSIDPFPAGRARISYGHLIAKVHYSRKKLLNVKLIKGMSQDVAHRFFEKIDFLFVDADHSYEAIKRDWEDWFPKVKCGGIIALHDCKQAPNSPEYLGSMQFYTDYVSQLAEVHEIGSADSLVVFRRTGD